MTPSRAGGPAPPPAGTGMAGPVAALDWDGLARELDDHGCAPTGPVLAPAECARIAALYAEPERFRSTVDMERHRFGRGAYRYFGRPLPAVVEQLRQAFYPRLLPVARRWATLLGEDAPWPDTLDEWLAQCHAAGQPKPTPLLFRYGAGDWNALHRDLYGELVFPLQVVIGLDDPGTDFT
ncbi:MAG: 2OG-Fe(II) oxygenase, partial [Acidimicrobiales bacterium]